MTKRNVRNRRHGRDTTDIATESAPGLQYRNLDFVEMDRRRQRSALIDAYYESLPDVEDRRLYVPVPVDRLWGHHDPGRKTLQGSPARFVYKPIMGPSRDNPTLRRSVLANQFSHRIGFERPRSVITCIRRKVRKRVLMALGVGGSSTKYFRKRKLTWSSMIGC